MKVSLNWLKEYINVDEDLEPTIIAEKLTMAGLEVEAVEERYNYFDNVVVAKVIEVKQHPNADKLSVCQVDAGGEELIQIVCGAPNVHDNMFVPCALPGAVLPGDFKIKKGKLRGEVSAGMLCSGSELKLDLSSAGIMDLEGKFTPGTPFVEALTLSDTIFEIDLTPNRPDCLSYIGVAREVGAFADPVQKISFPDYSLPKDKINNISIHDHARVQIIDSDLCPRYSAGLLFDVKIEPSPFWLQEKLESIGLTPVNNVVDITNFVMMETGQPLHAFDFDEVAKGEIIVKRAGNDAKFTTLDSKEHKLESDMLMICDGARPVALAGVMGGENSEISNSTTKVLVESAYFHHVSIRKTAKKTGIASDASHRFERGADPEGTVNALNRALALIAKVCDGASIAKDIIDEYPQRVAPLAIDLNCDALNIRLGTKLDADKIKHLLESVDFEVDKVDDARLKVDIPSFRVDVTRPEDLSEEIARLWGYNNIETSYPLIAAKGRLLDRKIGLRANIRQIMTGFSFFEAINYNFINENSCDRLNLSDQDKRRGVETILNPISDQMSVLRSSLIPGLLETMRKNIAQQADSLKLFEIGKIFVATQKGSLPEENEVVSALITGNRSDQSWYSKKVKFDFFDLKGVVEGLLQGLMVKNISFEKIEDDNFPYYQNGYAGTIKSGDSIIGSLGKISTKVLKNYGLKQDAFIFDLNFKVLQALIPESVTAEPLPKFPSVARDITIIVDRSITIGTILEQFEKIAKKQSLIEKVSLFDAFEGKPLTENKKSLSFRIVYRAFNKTLKEKNIKKLHTNISKTIIDLFNADLPE
ncbi:MAG: phenylalanine--tRNA ligase subunit beta [Desulfobacula sp.]|nr:phenylalanine--tRNA ligase subunit beta [Desulfobacula sp.]